MTKVLIVASEGMPFVKTGGLADVVGALPKSLLDVGVDVAVMMPKHSKIKAEKGPELETIFATTIMLGWREKYLGIQTLTLNGIKYYFIDNEDYFDGPIYRGGAAEHEQYLYFCKAVCEALLLIDFDPDVLHLNDWHTGMIPFLVKEQYSHRYKKQKKLLFTIHNIKFQGQMDFAFLSDVLSVPSRYYAPDLLEADGCANMMKAGIVYADKISTVSPNYANEIMNSYFGMGMEGILSARRRDVCGILNGIDTEEFDPEADRAIAQNYTAQDIRGKLSCKKALMEEFGLNIRPGTPIISMVTRLTSQKGIDLVQYILEELLQDDIAFVMLGSGDEDYEAFFNYIAGKYPDKTGIYIGYDEDLAHRIYAGADFFLMPSEFEPCGLSQMIAQRYGNLPIVRETGGLVDTVSPYNIFTQAGNGFAFSTFNGHDMLASIKLALSVYRDKPILRRLKRNAMLTSNSFLKSAETYKELYESL
jgi:starch synthase